MQKIVEFVKKETVLVIAAILAVVSAFWVKPGMAYLEYIDWRVLAILLSLMIVMAGFQKNGLFDAIGIRLLEHTKNTAQLTFVLVFLCFFFSMIITNDVALLTFVPFAVLTLQKCKQERLMVIVLILQTIAANLGSMLTPIGNPQNLYLYSLTGMGLMEFILFMMPLTLLSMVILLLVILAGKREAVKADMQRSKEKADKKKLILYLGLFVLCMGTVIRILPWQISLLAVCVTGVFAFRNLFAQADYCLLGTFLGFFIFVGNMQRLPAVSELLEKLLAGRELFLGVIASQIISNVPAAMLLSGFTQDYKALLYGVDIGGLGTLIASLASLISYKYVCRIPGIRKGKYLGVFTFWNLLFLAILLPAAWLLLG